MPDKFPSSEVGEASAFLKARATSAAQGTQVEARLQEPELRRGSKLGLKGGNGQPVVWCREEEHSFQVKEKIDEKSRSQGKPGVCRGWAAGWTGCSLCLGGDEAAWRCI